MAITLVKPANNMQVVHNPQADDVIIFDFNASDVTLSKNETDLAIRFENGSQVILIGFYNTYKGQNMPVFVIDGAEIDGETFFTALNATDIMPAAGAASVEAVADGSFYSPVVGADLLNGINYLGGLDVPQGFSSLLELGEFGGFAQFEEKNSAQDTHVVAENPSVNPTPSLEPSLPPLSETPLEENSLPSTPSIGAENTPDTDIDTDSQGDLEENDGTDGDANDETTENPDENLGDDTTDGTTDDTTDDNSNDNNTDSETDNENTDDDTDDDNILDDDTDDENTDDDTSLTDEAPEIVFGEDGQANDNSVELKEDFLADGTNADADALTVSKSFTVRGELVDGVSDVSSIVIGNEEMGHITIDLTTLDGIGENGETYEIEGSLEDSNGLFTLENIVVTPDGEGGYIVNYDVVLNDNSLSHNTQGGSEDLSFDLNISATDKSGNTASGTLNVFIEDDAPTINGNGNFGEFNPNVIGSKVFDLDDIVNFGADGKATDNRIVLSVDPESGYTLSATTGNFYNLSYNGESLGFVLVDPTTNRITIMQVGSAKDTFKGQELPQLNLGFVIADGDGDTAEGILNATFDYSFGDANDDTENPDVSVEITTDKGDNVIDKDDLEEDGGKIKAEVSLGEDVSYEDEIILKDQDNNTIFEGTVEEFISKYPENENGKHEVEFNPPTDDKDPSINVTVTDSDGNSLTDSDSATIDKEELDDKEEPDFHNIGEAIDSISVSGNQLTVISSHATVGELTEGTIIGITTVNYDRDGIIIDTGIANDVVNLGKYSDILRLGDSHVASQDTDNLDALKANAQVVLESFMEGDDTHFLQDTTDEDSAISATFAGKSIGFIDMAHGGGGNDTIEGEGGTDLIFGGSGNDRIYGGADNDGLRGGSGDDILDGGTGADIIDGGTGNDIIHADIEDIIRGGEGFDMVVVLDKEAVLHQMENAEGVEMFIHGSGFEDKTQTEIFKKLGFENPQDVVDADGWNMVDGSLLNGYQEYSNGQTSIWIEASASFSPMTINIRTGDFDVNAEMYDDNNEFGQGEPIKTYIAQEGVESEFYGDDSHLNQCGVLSDTLFDIVENNGFNGDLTMIEELNDMGISYNADSNSFVLDENWQETAEGGYIHQITGNCIDGIDLEIVIQLNSL